jgi:1-aminocyclopropane-1-carboxylate deaminase
MRGPIIRRRAGTFHPGEGRRIFESPQREESRRTGARSTGFADARSEGASQRGASPHGDRPLDEWHAGTYGVPDETIDAIRLCARLEGVLTDPVYEGKSMAALIGLVPSGRIAPARGCSTRTWAVSLR